MLNGHEFLLSLVLLDLSSARNQDPIGGIETNCQDANPATAGRWAPSVLWL